MRHYLGGLEFKNGVLESFNFGDGRIVFHDTVPTLRFQYRLTDHPDLRYGTGLGNTTPPSWQAVCSLKIKTTTRPGGPIGVGNLMQMLREEFPDLKYGYFNPPMERIQGRYEADFAH